MPRPNLVKATTDDLLQALKSREDWTRHHAKRVIKERGRDAVLSRLAEWTKALDPHDPAFEHHRLEALWTYQTLDTPEPKLLGSLLHAKDARVRAAATRIVAAWTTRLAEPQAPRRAYRRRESTRSPRGRAGLGQIHNLTSADLATGALDQPVDTFLDYALWLTARAGPRLASRGSRRPVRFRRPCRPPRVRAAGNRIAWNRQATARSAEGWQGASRPERECPNSDCDARRTGRARRRTRPRGVQPVTAWSAASGPLEYFDRRHPPEESCAGRRPRPDRRPLRLRRGGCPRRRRACGRSVEGRAAQGPSHRPRQGQGHAAVIRAAAIEALVEGNGPDDAR